MTRQQFFDYYRCGNRLYVWIAHRCHALSLKQLMSLPDMVIHVDGSETDHSLIGQNVKKAFE